MGLSMVNFAVYITKQSSRFAVISRKLIFLYMVNMSGQYFFFISIDHQQWIELRLVVSFDLFLYIYNQPSF